MRTYTLLWGLANLMPVPKCAENFRVTGGKFREYSTAIPLGDAVQTTTPPLLTLSQRSINSQLEYLTQIPPHPPRAPPVGFSRCVTFSELLRAKLMWNADQIRLFRGIGRPGAAGAGALMHPSATSMKKLVDSSKPHQNADMPSSGQEVAHNDRSF
jgi:hypothetical protein